MAVSTNSRFSIAAGAQQTVAGPFDKFCMDVTPQFALGTKVELTNGDCFRYSHFGADTTQGKIVSQDISESSQVDLDNAVIAPASAVTTTDGAIGSRFVEVTIASVTVNQFAGSKLVITDDTGEGYTYDVLGNTATNDPATGNIRLALGQPLQVALDATSDVAIKGSKYANLEAATTTDIDVVGVSCANMDVSEASYGWIQEAGDVGILQNGAIAIGADCIVGAVAGSVATQATDGVLQGVAVCKITGDDTGYGVFTLTIK